MSGTEVALIRLATTVLGAATKALLTPDRARPWSPTRSARSPAPRSRTGWRGCSRDA
ncbi:hypothetical protein [Streptomyces cyaneofuscatus]|uniref:hypothetical protein n=1 Tax=Streptomyces cyaneofuscatus TaxID=66883 RepID=UPI00364CEE0D